MERTGSPGSPRSCPGVFGTRRPPRDCSYRESVCCSSPSTPRLALADSLTCRKTATVDPRSLAPGPLPKRVVDYGLVLKPDAKIEAAWHYLHPVPGTAVKGWNSTTLSTVRKTPIAINIETKAPDKSWTDGKPQLGIWTAALLTRLRKLPKTLRENFEIMAVPLIVVQGHDWHFLILSQSSKPSIQTTIWQKIDMGSTRCCFDTYKIITVLHYLIDWAERVWRPWFHSLIESYGDTRAT